MIQGLKPKIYEFTGTKMMFKEKKKRHERGCVLQNPVVINQIGKSIHP
jgi:hypothetical protein